MSRLWKGLSERVPKHGEALKMNPRPPIHFRMLMLLFRSGNGSLSLQAPQWLWLTRASCETLSFFFFKIYQRDKWHVSSPPRRCDCVQQSAAVSQIERLRDREKWRPEPAGSDTFGCQMFCEWAGSTHEINPPTCILTAIEREFSSLSSSLSTTSFFSVRLQSLQRGGKKREERLAAWLMPLWAHLCDPQLHLEEKSTDTAAVNTTGPVLYLVFGSNTLEEYIEKKKR